MLYSSHRDYKQRKTTENLNKDYSLKPKFCSFFFFFLVVSRILYACHTVAERNTYLSIHGVLKHRKWNTCNNTIQIFCVILCFILQTIVTADCLAWSREGVLKKFLRVWKPNDNEKFIQNKKSVRKRINFK